MIENESLLNCFAFDPGDVERLNVRARESSGLSSAINEFRSRNWLPESA